ncbi:MAG: agmatinase [Candidatus Neomarinimicrobiota bacterium]|nr:agmatinase [Candidatus Neomarinimicrobiota bacterium]
MPTERINLIGVPYDAKSSFLKGPSAAPAAIREVLFSGASNLFSETGVNLGSVDGFRDTVDLEIQNSGAGFCTIAEKASKILSKSTRPIFLGGDHSITFPLVDAMTQFHRPSTIIHFDAHPDLYDEFEGDRFSHACPFARIMESGLTDRLIQIGIRTVNDHQREQAEKFGVEMFELPDFPSNLGFSKGDAVYISLDLDVFDPAFVPGISHHEPGGMTVREVIGLIHGINAPIVGADLVELNPQRDLNSVTAAVAAKMVKEIAGKMVTY